MLGVDQLVVVDQQVEIEDVLVFGEEWLFVGEEGFFGVEIYYQVVVFYLVEVGVDGGGELGLFVWFLEDVCVGFVLVVFVYLVVYVYYIGCYCQQWLVVGWQCYWGEV